MRYREISPPDHLKQGIAAFWIADAGEFHNSVRILPDGCADLIIRHSKDDPHFSELLVVGEMREYSDVFVEKNVVLLGIRFKAGWLGTMCRFGMTGTADTVVPLKEMNRVLHRQLANRCRSNAKDFANEKLTAVAEAIAAFGGKPSPLVEKLTVEICGAGGVLNLSRRTKYAGYSLRHAERIFMAEVGISPKEFCRIVRFRKALNLIGKKDRSLAEVAVECGYYDQPHMNREFKRLAGASPATFIG